MIESPHIKKIVAEGMQKAKQDAIVEVLQARFGPVPEEIVRHLRVVRANKKLKGLLQLAARTADVEAFRERLFS